MSEYLKCVCMIRKEVLNETVQKWKNEVRE